MQSSIPIDTLINESGEWAVGSHSPSDPAAELSLNDIYQMTITVSPTSNVNAKYAVSFVTPAGSVVGKTKSVYACTSITLCPPVAATKVRLDVIADSGSERVFFTIGSVIVRSGYRSAK